MDLRIYDFESGNRGTTSSNSAAGMKRNAKLLKNHAAQGEFAALEAAEQFTLDEIQGWLCWSLFSARIRDISRLSKNSKLLARPHPEHFCPHAVRRTSGA